MLCSLPFLLFNPFSFVGSPLPGRNSEEGFPRWLTHPANLQLPTGENIQSNRGPEFSLTRLFLPGVGLLTWNPQGPKKKSEPGIPDSDFGN